MSSYHAFLLAIVAASSECPKSQEGWACMPVDRALKTCPAPAEVDRRKLIGGCGAKVRKVTGPGRLLDNETHEDQIDGPGCCYPVKESASTCSYGRPLRVEHASVLAPVVDDPAWSAAIAVQCGTLVPAVRAALVERWTRAALDEHASIAAFARVALDLLRHGAPPELLEQAHVAALDEVRHARQGFAIASALAGRPVGPGAFPLAGPLPLAEDLRAVAVEAALDGCIGETLASMLAREAAEVCVDPAIRDVLLGIADDEQRHALLGWRTVAWAMRTGGPAVRAAVAAVFAGAARDGVSVPLCGDCDDPTLLARVGLLSRDSAHEIAARTLREVILSGARALLGEAAPMHAPSMHVM